MRNRSLKFLAVLLPFALWCEGCSSSSAPAGVPFLDRINKDKSPAATASAPTETDDGRAVLSSAVPETLAFTLAAQDAAADAQPNDVRYFSLAHVQSLTLDQGALDVVAKATSKMINSLSFAPKPVPPQVIDKGGALLKIRLSDYGWSAARWEVLASGHPEATDATIAGLADLKGRTGTRKPVLRAEWFVTNASAPPLYYQLANLPPTRQALEQLLKVDLDSDLRAGNVMRAGFSNSQVSTNQRVVERHAAPYGVIWQSYEFGTKAGNQNIFAFPLGPGGSGNGSSSGVLGSFGGLLGGGGSSPQAFAFASDGSEFIFTLPNGLFGYYIADAAGKRLDQVPGIPSKSKQIRPGAICMNCHAQGYIKAVDMMVGTTAKNSSLADIMPQIRRFYPEANTLVTQIAQDSTIFQNGLKTLGIDGSVDGDPVSRTIGYNIPQ